MKFLFSFIFLLIMHAATGQNLSTHQWKNRLVLMVTDNPATPEFQRQLEAFRKDEKGLKERKIKVYQVLPDQYKTGLNDDNAWKTSNELYNKYKRTKSDFEIFLIGLDGGIKLKDTKFLSCEKLFATIDVMPMRRAEMRRMN